MFTQFTKFNFSPSLSSYLLLSVPVCALPNAIAEMHNGLAFWPVRFITLDSFFACLPNVFICTFRSMLSCLFFFYSSIVVTIAAHI